jgi:hypothetical protein
MSSPFRGRAHARRRPYPSFPLYGRQGTPDGARIAAGLLLLKPGRFEGLGVAEEVLRAEDLPASEGDELPEFLA